MSIGSRSIKRELGLFFVPEIWRDSYVLLALVLGVLVGLFLNALMPGGYAQKIWSNPLVLLSFLLLQPIFEEILFRGVIQGQILSFPWGSGRWFGLSFANTLASVLFSLLHLVHHSPFWAFWVFFPSLIYGFLRERHGSIWPALVVHFFYNLIYLVAGM